MQSANQRKPAETTANRNRAIPFSINLSIHLISSSLPIYVCFYLSAFGGLPHWALGRVAVLKLGGRVILRTVI